MLVDEYQDTNRAQYRLLQLLAAEHRNVCAVGDPDQSIYAFRGADIRNILEFERDFGETRTVALEQNYRSTNSILEAANAVIANNRERKPKELWSELGDGDPVRVIEVEDEQAESRFVATEIARLVEEGFSGREIAVFYRMNAQSRVLEQTLRLAQIPYQVIGGPALLRAGRGQGRDRLPAGDRQPGRRDLAAADREPAAARDRRHLARAPAGARRRDGHLALRGARAARGCGDQRRAAARAPASCTRCSLSFQRPAQELEVPELLGSVLERSGMIEAFEAERTVEARGRIENLEAFVDGAREYADDRGRAVALRLPAGDLALLRPGRDRARRRAP